MDRNQAGNQKSGKLRRKGFAISGILQALLLALSTFPHHALATQAEEFPESRFGQAPARPNSFGVDAGFAGREADEWQPTTVSKGAKRGPASAISDTPETAGLSVERDRPSPRAQESGSNWSSLDGGRAPASLREHSQAAAPGETGQARRKGVQEIGLIAGDLGYFPKTFFVTRDVPVRLYVTGASKNTLCIMMDSFQVRKQVKSQKVEEISFTPSEPGQFRFYCPVNGMEGTMVVKDLATSLTSN